MGGVFTRAGHEEDEGFAYDDEFVVKKIRVVCANPEAVPKTHENGSILYLFEKGMSPLAIGALNVFRKNDKLTLEAAKDVFARRVQFRKDEEYPDFSQLNASELCSWLQIKGFFSKRTYDYGLTAFLRCDAGSKVDNNEAKVFESETFWAENSIVSLLKAFETRGIGSVPRLLQFLSTCSFSEDEREVMAAVAVMNHLNVHFDKVVRKFLQAKAINAQRLRLYALSLACNSCYHVHKRGGFERPAKKDQMIQKFKVRAALDL